VTETCSASAFRGGIGQLCTGSFKGSLRLLPKAHYLSTVSGGGYIGAWLKASCDGTLKDMAA
jgi:hypothetical protein